MKAFILAAGRGERMRPLTDACPKPLLEVGGEPLIVWHLQRLASAGIDEVVINTARLGELIEARLGNGSAWGLRLHYSREGPEPLGTAAGIRRALNILGEAPFLLVNGDVWTDFDFTRLTLAANDLAQLVLVPNPEHHPEGDFTLEAGGRVGNSGAPRYTYSGIACLDPALFGPAGSELPGLLRRAADAGRCSGQRHGGAWIDVGTPERLARLDWTLRRGEYMKNNKI